MSRPLQVKLKGRRFKRQCLILRMVLDACEHKEQIAFQTLVRETMEYGAKLTPPITEGEAESMLVLFLEHML